MAQDDRAQNQLGGAGVERYAVAGVINAAGEVLVRTFPCLCEGEPCEGLRLPMAGLETEDTLEPEIGKAIEAEFGIKALKIHSEPAVRVGHPSRPTEATTCVVRDWRGTVRTGTWVDPIRLLELTGAVSQHAGETLRSDLDAKKGGS